MKIIILTMLLLISCSKENSAKIEKKEDNLNHNEVENKLDEWVKSADQSVNKNGFTNVISNPKTSNPETREFLETIHKQNFGYVIGVYCDDKENITEIMFNVCGEMTRETYFEIFKIKTLKTISHVVPSREIGLDIGLLLDKFPSVKVIYKKKQLKPINSKPLKKNIKTVLCGTINNEYTIN